jgi:DNA helicase IV
VIDGISSYGHVVADEAQDLSPMQLRAIGRRCRYGSATLLGDLAQGTSPWAAGGWGEALPHVGKALPRLEVLPRAFRVPREVLDFANRLLPTIAPQVRPPASVRSAPGSLVLRASSAERFDADWLDALAQALAAEGSVGLIVADPEAPSTRAELERRRIDHRMVERFDLATRLSLVPASTVKGLEFDQVVLLEPADLVDADPQGLRRLYIAMTRAVSRLQVVHARPLPAPLTGWVAA